jgi:hypothetical protein
MDVIIECDTTEYTIVPNKEYRKTIFSITENSLVISFCTSEGVVITQSEIEIKDAIKLANILKLTI